VANHNLSSRLDLASEAVIVEQPRKREDHGFMALELYL
jgi:hypothetical protein